VVSSIKMWLAADALQIFSSRLTSAMPPSTSLASQRLGERAAEMMQTHEHGRAVRRRQFPYHVSYQDHQHFSTWNSFV
jgi:hypothetical protein